LPDSPVGPLALSMPCRSSFEVMSTSIAIQNAGDLSVAGSPDNDQIVVRGARTHNLKNIDFEIPHNAMTVVTGVSGSGKSSLAFDTVYAEGQRRYVESLSAYARQFLERIEKPDADHIEGIAPAVAIRQKNTTRSPRSTVGTATEIYDYLRLLFARIGRTYCIQCGAEVRKDTVDEVADAVVGLGEGTRLSVLFPVTPGSNPINQNSSDVIPNRFSDEEPFDGLMAGPAGSLKAGFSTGQRDSQANPAASLGMTGARKMTGARGRRKKEPGKPRQTVSADAIKSRLFELRQRGFNRLFQRRQVFEFSTPESLLDINFTEPLFVLVDRIALSPDSRARIVDATEISFRESSEVIFETAPHEGEQSRQLRFSQKFECKNCGITYAEPEPRLFSFNNPYGACPRCQGFGNTIDFDLALVIPDTSKTLNECPIEPWTKPKYRPYATEMKRFARSTGIPLDVAWANLEPEQQKRIIHGDRKFPGIRGFFNYLERKKYKLHVRVFLSRYRGYSVCSECNGARLRREAQQVKIGGKNICEVCSMTVEQAAEFFSEVQLRRQESDIAERLLHEIRSRLRFLNEVGLEYLMLDRLTSTLSGGEAQRIQLATSLGSNLVGTLYVLDEPSIGLHSRDTHRLIRILHGLRDLGNTVLVVEHDADVMRASDHILDLGPGAGEHGGKIVGSGTYEQIQRTAGSLTGRYLADELHIQIPANRRRPGRGQITIRGARAHNLKNIDVTIPLGMLVAITGVSGSGKSTLLHDVLYQTLSSLKKRGENSHFFQSQNPRPVAHDAARVGHPSNSFPDALEGEEFIDDIVLVDQSPIGRTPRSNPVTYLKAFDGIRELFAATPEAHKRGFSAGHFSFNVAGGRCETCQGDGTVTVEMQFLADVELVCEECKGKRFKPEVLEVHYRGKSIHEVLEMTVREAMHHFAGSPKVADKLRVLDEVGLGYLRLGQSATTLSGGEAQRVKLAAHLAVPALSKKWRSGWRARPKLLYIFDEPTTGLHFDDISKLLTAFRRLIETGGSILLIEHNLEVIKTADWVIDLGPEGGERGGNVVGEGTPEKIAALQGSYTGQFLARVLNGAARGNGPE
jgi:excinuclease ABC subunit A